MNQMRIEKLQNTLSDFERAYESYTPSAEDRSLSFLALSKAFEISIEYAWKYFKYLIEERGLEALSPRDVAKEGASLKLISNPQLWIDAINARNLSVHDYFSMPEGSFVSLANEFIESVKKDLKRLK